MATLKLTQKGYEQFLLDISNKEEELRQLCLYKGREAVNHGDVWHDNNSFEQVEIQERALRRTITDMKSKLNNIEIIEEETKDSSVVNIGSTVFLKLEYSDDFSEDISGTISGEHNINADSSAISINSPLCNCIIGKSVGFSGYYKVNSSEIKVTILNIT